MTWRWAELPVKGAESEEELDDDVMTGMCTTDSVSGTCTVHVLYTI